MSDCIERAEAIRICERLRDKTDNEDMAFALNWAIQSINNIPAADVRPAVHGHWVYEEPNSANSFKGAYWCDQCHQPESYRKNFCHNCGADMREANDGTT